MDLATITMEPEAAQVAFEQYRAAVRERHDAEDEAIMRGYRELAAGRQLVKLSECVKAGGVERRIHAVSGPSDLPKVAVARADLRWVRCLGVEQSGSVRFYGSETLNPLASRLNVTLGQGTFEHDSTRRSGYWGRHWRAMVPTIPPGLRPSISLANYHVLFEADWSSSPPVDPALLRRLGGDLYAVVAIWNLTELERAVLSGRNQE